MICALLSPRLTNDESHRCVTAMVMAGSKERQNLSLPEILVFFSQLSNSDIIVIVEKYNHTVSHFDQSKRCEERRRENFPFYEHDRCRRYGKEDSASVNLLIRTKDMCISESKGRERGLATAASSLNEIEGDIKTKVCRRRHLWSTVGLCGSAFSMFYLIMNVFPYSGFMALHLLNGRSQNDNDGDDTQHRILHITAAAIGPYAGILASSFRLGRIPTAISWGRCADIYGRKFALIIGILAMIAGNILFALAPTFAVAVGIRFSAGLLNGTMVVVRTSISEIAWGDRNLETKGVAMMSSVSGYAMLIAPAIGGLLSNPIRQYPSYFSNYDAKEGAMRLFWKSALTDYPFLLPNLIGSFVATISLLIVVFCVEETLPEDQRIDWRLIPRDIRSWITSKVMLPKKKNSASAKSPSQQIITADERTPLVSSGDRTSIPEAKVEPSQVVCGASIVQDENSENSERSNKKSTFESLRDSTSNVKFFFYSMWLFAFSSLASLEAFPLFAMASISQGGLGFDEARIGIVQTIGGCVFVFGQYAAFSTATSKIGVMKAIRFSTFGRIFLVILFPLGLYFSNPTDSECDVQTDIYTINSNSSLKCIRGKNWYQLGYLGLVTGIISILGSIFMGCSTIGVNACLTDASQRASMNGLQSMVASIGRGLGPIVAGYLVAATMKSGTISASASAWVVYGVLMVIESITHVSTRVIPDYSICSNAKKEGEKESGGEV